MYAVLLAPAVLAFLYVLALIIIALAAFRQLFNRTFHTLEYSRHRCLESGEFDPALEELPWEEVKVFSPKRNAAIAVYALPARNKNAGTGECGGTVIVLHGLTWTHYGSFKYAGAFIERGWNAVLVDMGGHGASGAGNIPVPSYGYFEKYDIDAVLDWTLARFSGEKPFVLIGESLGAATALQYAPLGAPPGATKQEWKIQGIIADCPYSSMADAVDAQLKHLRIPFFLAGPARKFISFVMRHTRGYALEDASPLAGALSSPVPILLIHGDADDYVPSELSRRIAEKRKEKGAGPVSLVLIHGAAHAKSIVVDPGAWFKAAFEFIGRECIQ
ncbi:MAG: alpha/beta fold hydrolase [Spirochaetaceae bacterium]|jgi:alpha-beta hydrolase superfamily lysophospholipase|nr:alpha/beta fold hydrolase [Spirochaetaceae bacterium]